MPVAPFRTDNSIPPSWGRVAEGKKEEKIYKEIIYKFLKDNKGRFTGKEIMLNLGIPEQALYKSLKELVENKEIKKENHRYYT